MQSGRHIVFNQYQFDNYELPTRKKDTSLIITQQKAVKTNQRP
jgi:hypothetical protein